MIKQIQLMIVGAQKAGTSSLIRYVGEHPNICIPIRPEMNYFTRDDQYILGYKKIFPIFFKSLKNQSSIVMAKQASLMYLPKCVKRLRDHNQEMHLVALLRNPIDRAYSAFWFFRRVGREVIRSFEEALEAEQDRLKENFHKWHHCAYLDRGIYFKQILTLYDYFPRENVHISLFDDFKKNPSEVCQSIFGLFDLPNFIINVGTHYNKASIARSEKVAHFMASKNPIKKFVRHFMPDKTAFYINNYLRRLNRKKLEPPKMRYDTRKRLLEYFSPYNKELSKLLNRDLSHWNR